MDCMHAHRLFTTAELLREIIERIDTPATAARCARVNRTWYKEATIVLWRGCTDQSSPWRTPDSNILWKLARVPERFTYYVSFIKHLVLLHGATALAQMFDPGFLFTAENWATCTAQTILVDLGSSKMKEHFMRVLINPSLKTLALYGGYYSDSFFRTIRETCALRLLLVDNRSKDVTQLGLAECSRMMMLEYLELSQGFEGAIDTATLRLFLQTPSLKHLCISNLSFNARLFRDMVISPSLRSLDVTCDRASLRDLFRQLPQLQSFRILLQAEAFDIGEEVLRPISACSQLCELFIKVDHPHSTFDPTALLVLAQSCPLIHTLDIDGRLPGPIEAHHLTNALKKWTNMSFFAFLLCFVEGFGLLDLATIAKSCPKLLYFSMATEIRESAFDPSKITFPSLLSFYVEKVVVERPANVADVESEAACRVAAQLHGCMPKMTSIHNTEFASDDETGPLILSNLAVSKHLAKLAPGHTNAPNNVWYASIRRDIEDSIALSL